MCGCILNSFLFHWAIKLSLMLILHCRYYNVNCRIIIYCRFTSHYQCLDNVDLHLQCLERSPPTLIISELFPKLFLFCWVFAFPMFENKLSNFYKQKTFWDFQWNCITFIDQFGRLDTLVILSSPKMSIAFLFINLNL